MNVPYSLSFITVGFTVFSLTNFCSLTIKVFPFLCLIGLGSSFVGLGIYEGTSESAIFPNLLISEILSLYLSTEAAKDGSVALSKI
jgi:hypothetical protein